MKRSIKWLGIAVLFAVAVAGCDISGGSGGSGGLTITGIPEEYNGKYAFAEGEQGYNYLIAAATLKNDETGTAGKISNGSVTLKVFTFDEQTEKVVAFKGSGRAEFEVLIFNTASLEDAFEDESSIVGFGSVEVTFADGTGSGVFIAEEPDEEVEFIGVTADGEEDTETTTELTLRFDKAITGLSASDITLTTPDGARGTKGTLSGPTGSGPVTYTLGFAVTVGGTIRVAVEKDGYEISPYRQTVTVYFVDEEEAVVFNGVTADGNATTTTTALTLSFDTAIEGLAAGDITLTPALAKGTLGTAVGTADGDGPVTYTLPVTVTAAGTVSVKVEKEDYTISGSPKTVTVYYNADITVTEGSTLAEKLAWLETNAVSNTTYTLEVTADETLARQGLSYYGKSGVTIILKGIGSERVISLARNGTLFDVASWSDDSGITLELDSNITLQGCDPNNNPLVRVDSGGTLNMKAGAKITGNAHGGGVNVSRGTFTMSGGEISDNTGRGVYVSDATFTMSGGTISGNGGGVSVSDATFTMNGGTISGNVGIEDEAGSGGGVYVDGQGMYGASTFTMTGGTISGNKVTGGTSWSSGGGGVFVVSGGTFTMTGGTISGNEVTGSSGNGGGVFVGDATFTMNGGTISGNEANRGGGVYVSGAIFRIVSGTIYGSDATPDALKNTATGGTGAAFSGTAEYGTFSGSTWNKTDDLATTNDTITVEDGILQ